MSYPRIVFMRHGETEWNLAGRAQGHLNSPLTAKGQAQAQRLGEILKRELITPEGYTQMVSPIGRTLETSANIKKHFPFDPTPIDLLKEIDLGKLSGLNRAEMEEQFPDHMAGKPDYDWYFGAPDGETMDDMRKRATQWLDSLIGPTIAVAHGQIGKVIRGVYLGLSDEQILRLQEPQGVVHLLDHGTETIWS
ncbi:histidine phosphatase family protein [Cohaesibacter intestini]|uniref:histidine phosphatase family protein n=1 Tax=Cohaesibacter intestini TaxID=2211145 RepID=UPI001300908E|nr:histidine phosphatase family protein [Cohaesibacter intestini]